MNVGEILKVVFMRGEKEEAAKIQLRRRMDNHDFEEMDQLTEQPKFLRDVWQRNF